MPLITKLVQRRERDMPLKTRIQDASLQVQQTKDSDYEDFDIEDECLDSDMEGSVVPRARLEKVVRAPILPARNEKRASKMLKDIMLDVHSMNGSKEKDMDTKSVVVQDPHELYLSSEEEGSLSDDEYADSLLDFEPLEDGDLDLEARAQSSGASSRKSQEVTARAVSFTLVKPQIVDISHNTSPSSMPPRPCSSAFETRSSRNSIFEARTTSLRSGSPSRTATRRPSPLRLYPSSIRRMSISSMAQLSQTSTSLSVSSAPNISPPRKSSRMANLASLVTNSLHHNSTTHAFLQTDPFPSAASSHNKQPTQAEVQTPITPTKMAADAFKRGLHKARKPSLQKLNAAFSPRNSSMLNLSQPQGSEIERSPVKQQRRKSLAFPRSLEEEAPSTPQDGPLRYEDIMKNVIKTTPSEKMSPAKTRTSFFGGLGRRKSVRIV